MDLYTIAIASFAGAITGALIGKFGNENKKAKNGAIFLFVFLNSIGNTPQVRNFIMPYFDSNYLIKLEISDKLRSSMERDDVKRALEKFKTSEEANQYAQLLVKNGISKFEYADLKNWNRLRLIMAEKSFTMCSGFWSGRITEDDIFTVLSTMDKKDLDSYMNMTNKAIDTELKSLKQYEIRPQEFVIAFNKLRSMENVEESAKMQMLLERGASVSDEEGCYLIKKMMRGAAKLDDKSAEGLLRYWALI